MVASPHNEIPAVSRKRKPRGGTDRNDQSAMTSRGQFVGRCLQRQQLLHPPLANTISILPISVTSADLRRRCKTTPRSHFESAARFNWPLRPGRQFSRQKPCSLFCNGCHFSPKPPCTQSP